MEEIEIEVVLNLGKLKLHRWRKNGDHPHDRVGQMEPDPSGTPDANGEVGSYRRQEGAVVRYFRRPDCPGTLRCPRCLETWHAHGWIDSGGPGRVVCPGDWVGYLCGTGAMFAHAFPDDVVQAARHGVSKVRAAREAADALDEELGRSWNERDLGAEDEGPVHTDEMEKNHAVARGLAMSAAASLEQAEELVRGD